MNVSKSVFVVLLMSIVSALMLASLVSAIPPTVSLSGTPSTAAPGQSFTVTVTATDAVAGQFVSTIFLSNSQGWVTSPSTSVACNVQSCSQAFTLTVPAGAANGVVSTLTASANNNLGEVSAQSQATVTVATSVPPASGNPSVAISGVTSNTVPGTSFKVTVTASDTAASHVVNSITLTNTRSWSVSPSNTVSCGQQVCSADFNVAVPSGEIVGTINTFTATATNNVAGGSASTSSATTVSASPSIGGKAPVTVDGVLIDNFELSPTDTTVRDMQRGQTFALKVKLTASADAKDIEIRAFVTGFEFAQNEPISDSAGPFDVKKGVSYVKTLNLKLPDRVQEDTYRIRVIIGGRDNDEVTQDFRIQVTPSAHDVVVKDFSITPQDTVQAGRAILSTVRVKNQGDKNENDVKIQVSIPELGVTASPDFINELKSDESATSEEFFLRVDPCARPGTYDVKALVTFSQGDKTVAATKQITVTKGACDASAGPSSVSANGVKIVYNAEPQNVEMGGAAVSYLLTIMNGGADTKTYSLSVIGADWATVKLSPSNIVTVKPGDSQTVYAFVSAKSGAAAGGQSFTIRVKDQAGDVVKELPLSANVVEGTGAGVGSLVQLLQLGLIVLIVVLVVVGVVVAFRRMKGPGAGEEGTQTYY